MAGLLELIVAELRADPTRGRELAAELAQLVPDIIGPAQPEPLLTVQQAAERAQVSEKTIRRRIDSGELPATRVGTRVRVDPEQLQSFLEARGEWRQGSSTAQRRRRDRSGLSIVAEAFRQLEQG